MRGTISRDSWDVPVDLFFYRDPEELEKAEEAAVSYEEAAPVYQQAPMEGGYEQQPPPDWNQPQVGPDGAPIDPNQYAQSWEGQANQSWNQ